MTTDGLHLDIDVRDAGVLNATIRHGGHELQFRASYMSDALGDLAATVAIAGDAAQPRTRSFSWANEPGYWGWDFTREDDNVAVVIAYVTDEEANAPDRVLVETSRGTTRFTASVRPPTSSLR